MKTLWKKPMLRVVAVAVAAVVLVGSGGIDHRLPAVRADDTKKSDPADNDRESFTTKATKRTPATAINFNKSLGLPFDSLRTLGSRIEAARRKPDPVALAHQASELAVAEKVSKKTAGLTSKALIQESAELAAARKQEAELQAVQQVALQVQVEEQNIKLLKEQIAMSQQIAKQDREAFNSKQEPTSKPRQVIVNNYTSQYVDVYINGNYMNQLDPGSSQVFTLNQRINPTTLKAYGNEDTDVWNPAPIWGKFTKYTWNIQ
jgi:hypothetical protein